jgi:hypothetical protein
MTQSGKRRPGVTQIDHSGQALHLFAVARAHELHALAERCAAPLVKAPTPSGRLAWWRRFLRVTQ